MQQSSDLTPDMNPTLIGVEEAPELTLLPVGTTGDAGYSFLRDVGLIAGGTVIAQLINALIYPVLTRLYAPADFGLFALVVSVYATVVVVASGRYEAAMMMPSDDGAAASVLYVALALCLVSAGVSLPVLLLTRLYLAHAIGAPQFADWAWITPLMLMLAGIYSVQVQWCTRRGYFRVISAVAVSLAATIALFKVLIPLLTKQSAAGLILGQLLGQAVATAMLAVVILRSDADHFVQHPPELRAMWDAVVRYKDFGLYGAPRTLLNMVANWSLVPVVALFMPSREVGLFTLARAVTDLPIRPVCIALDQVFYRRAARERHDRALGRFAVRLIGVLALVTVPVVVLFALNAQHLFDIVFGRAWSGAGAIAAALSFSSCATLLTSWTARLFDVHEEQHLALGLEFAYAIASIGTFATVLRWRSNVAVATEWYAVVAVLFAVSRTLVAFTRTGVGISDGRSRRAW